MGKAGLAAELLLTRDSDRAAELARELCELNRERQAVEGEIFQDSVRRLEETPQEGGHPAGGRGLAPGSGWVSWPPAWRRSTAVPPLWCAWTRGGQGIMPLLGRDQPVPASGPVRRFAGKALGAMPWPPASPCGRRSFRSCPPGCAGW